METIHLVMIAIIVYLLLTSKERYETPIGYNGGSYSSPEGMIDWLNISDLEYGKLVSKLQGKNQAVTIRNLV